MKRLLLILALIAPPLMGQAVRYNGNIFTINSSAPQPGGLYPMLANTSATVQICGYSTSQTCPALSTTYTNAAQSFTCPTTAQLTPSNSGACRATVDAQGNFGAWLVAGNYQYMVTTSYGKFGPYDFTVGGASAGGGCSTGGIPTTNGSVTGDSTSTNCGTGNRVGDALLIPADTSTFGYNNLLNAPADPSNGKITAVGTNNFDVVAMGGLADAFAENIAIGDSNGNNLAGNEMILMGDSNGNHFSGNSSIGIGISTLNNLADGSSQNVALGDGVLNNETFTTGVVSSAVCLGDGTCKNVSGNDIDAGGDGDIFTNSGISGEAIITGHDYVVHGDGNLGILGDSLGHSTFTGHDVTLYGDTNVFSLTRGTNVTGINLIGIGQRNLNWPAVGGTYTFTDIVAVGHSTCDLLGTGSSDVYCFGHSITASNATINNAIGIGVGITLASNTTTIGNSSITQNIVYGVALPGLIYSAAGTALPSCASGLLGGQAVVSDATTPTYLGTYTGGGAVMASVLCNGTSWVTH